MKRILLFRHLYLTIIACMFAFGFTNAVNASDEKPFPEVVPANDKEKTTEDSAESSLSLMNISYDSDDPYLYRIHPNAFYHLIGFSESSEVILHDASSWTVPYLQRHIIYQWNPIDELFIKPNVSCFSPYKYVLHNRTTQQTVEANLSHYPLLGINSFVIMNIEPYARLVLLNDNTVWQVDFADRNFPYWQIGQRVIIGLNNRWRSASMTHILINVDMYNQPFSLSNFYGYPVGY